MSKTEKLIELKELLDLGLISQSDFDRLKKLIFENPQQAFEEINKSKTSDFIDNIKKRRAENKEEINQTVNVQNPKLEVTNRIKDYKFHIIGVLVFIILIFTVSYFLNREDNKKHEIDKETTVKDTILIQPAPTLSVDKNYNKETNDSSEILTNFETDDNSNSNITSDINNEDNNEINNVISLELVEEVPLFSGCNEVQKNNQLSCFKQQMSLHVKKYLQYPESAMEKNIQGKIYVSFIIDENGFVKDIQTDEDSGIEILELEAKRVIEKLPKFRPGLENGKPVRVKYVQPFTFKLQ